MGLKRNKSSNCVKILSRVRGLVNKIIILILANCVNGKVPVALAVFLIRSGSIHFHVNSGGKLCGSCDSEKENLLAE